MAFQDIYTHGTKMPRGMKHQEYSLAAASFTRVILNYLLHCTHTPDSKMCTPFRMFRSYQYIVIAYLILHNCIKT